MRVLVIEDNEAHRESARQTLAEHELTVVGSFDEAMALMSKGFHRTITPLQHEVVLTDMMLPMSQDLEPSVYRNDELVNYGFVLALRAVLCGAKYVAMLTDTNHHMTAVSASLNYLGPPYYPMTSLAPNFIINGAKVMFVHTPFTKEKRKDWGRVLADLMA